MEEVKRLGSRQAVEDYYYPNPSEGTWSAIYSKDFAEKYHLPASGISDELDDYIDYMEIIAERYVFPPGAKPDSSIIYPKVMCYVNILANKGNDISLYGNNRSKDQKQNIHNHFYGVGKPLQAIPADKYQATFRNIVFGNEWAIHSADLIAGYDYFSMRGTCKYLLLDAYRNKQDYINPGIRRTSVFGEYVIDLEQGRLKKDTKNKDWYRSIVVPYSLLNSFYGGVNVPPPPALYRISPLQGAAMIALSPLALPLVAGMATDSWGAGKSPQNPQKYSPAPEGPTHFRINEK